MVEAVRRAVGEPANLTDTAAADLGRTARELLAVGATPGEVGPAARRYRARWPDAACTHRALRVHWAALTAEEEDAQEETDGDHGEYTIGELQDGSHGRGYTVTNTKRSQARQAREAALAAGKPTADLDAELRALGWPAGVPRPAMTRWDSEKQETTP